MRHPLGNRYVLLKSQDGEFVPAIILPNGEKQPLHSMVDAKREANRLASTIPDDTGFLIFLGLGGGFIPQAALEKTTAKALVIDYDKDGITELLSLKDYSALLNNERLCLLIDPSFDEIKNFILENYNPSLCGGIKTIPLRTRIEHDLPLFNAAAQAVQQAIDTVSGDFSVQAHFGKRWFSNIIRNIKNAEAFTENSVNTFKAGEAAVVAAGPSLDMQIPSLAECKSRNVFIICSDTAMPALLANDIKPDAVVSIDCQHISCYHFMGCKADNIPLFLDIASPPLLSRFTTSPLFFCGGHPLAQYICANWRPLPRLDTSGGNVTYSCLSLAQRLGAKRITLFGADFSYINSRTYARGTYIYPYFERKQSRFCPLEAQSSAFLYRSPFLAKNDHSQIYYETSSLRFYREKLEEKASTMDAQITVMRGQGAPINLKKTTSIPPKSAQSPAPVKNNLSGIDFLEQYRRDIAALPVPYCTGYLQKLNAGERKIFATLLPCAAALKHRNPGLKGQNIIEQAKLFCLQEIDRVIQ